MNPNHNINWSMLARRIGLGKIEQLIEESNREIG